MIQQDQEIFNILLEMVSDAVLIVDDQQHIMEVNAVAETMFGYTKTEIKNKPLNVLLPSSYHDKFEDKLNTFINRYMTHKMGKTTDLFGLKKDGTVIPVQVDFNPFKIYDKNYVICLVKDMSERKEIEKKLLLKSSALESASNGIVITDALQKDNPIVYCNTAFEKLTGYTNKEILNRNCRFLQGTDKQQAGLKVIRKALKNNESCQVTIRNYKKNGTLFWNDLYIIPITNTSGVVTNFIGIQNDITPIKKAEDERNHLANIIHESLNEIYVFDSKTFKFINVNYGAQKNLGYTIDELLTMTPLDLKIDETNFYKYVNQLKTNPVGKLEFETLHHRKDGSIYPVEVHLQLNKLAEKEVFVAIILDITERKTYTEKLERKVEERTKQLKIALSKEKELNDLKTKFLSLVSHEFKTPLSGISTSAMLAEKYTQTKDQGKRRKHLEIIKDKVQYLNNILNDFLSIERLESGAFNYRFDNFKLSKIINEVVYNANMLLKEGQRINYPNNIDDISLCQDERIMELVLSNVLQNAIKYSHENSEINLSVYKEKNNVVFKVEDAGIGIPKKDLANIFTRYFRAENVLNMQGTGIGLNIVKTHLENLGGAIAIESIEHKGTTVTLHIPNKIVNG
jgi:PAS domain S-box-containing protein